MDIGTLATEIEAELRAGGGADRAEHERAYLRSDLDHFGTPVPTIRAVARTAHRQHPDLDHDALIALVDRLWDRRVHECRLAAVELLAAVPDRLTVADLPLVERLLRGARTWALVDPLSTSVVAPLAEHQPATLARLDRWAADTDHWVRRAALLALLPALRRGEGDFERFGRYADAMLDDGEPFIRKAIGWVLRETGKRRPALVHDWLLPRAHRASSSTVREALKPLSAEQRDAILAARAP